MDRAEIERRIRNHQTYQGLSREENLQLLQLELLLKIFDTLDKLPGMLDSIDDRISDIAEDVDCIERKVNNRLD